MIGLGPLRLRLDVHIEDPVLAGLVGDLLTDLQRSADAVGRHEVITVRGSGPWHIRSAALRATDITLQGALAQTLAAVNLTAVSQTPLLAFHAAVVSRHGRTLVVPGRSGTGKSTLTACLVRQGWDYVSDEALAIDQANGDVVAYPRPLGLSRWSCVRAGVAARPPAGGEAVLRARDLGGSIDWRPPPVSCVVLLDRSAPEECPSIVHEDRNVALRELLARGFTHHRDGARALEATAAVLRSSQVLRLLLGDPWAAATFLTRVSDT